MHKISEATAGLIILVPGHEIFTMCDSSLWCFKIFKATIYPWLVLSVYFSAAGISSWNVYWTKALQRIPTLPFPCNALEPNGRLAIHRFLTLIIVYGFWEINRRWSFISVNKFCTDGMFCISSPHYWTFEHFEPAEGFLPSLTCCSFTFLLNFVIWGICLCLPIMCLFVTTVAWSLCVAPKAPGRFGAFAGSQRFG